MKKKFVDDLLSKKMDRKEFLQFMGGAVLLLTGVAGVMKSLRRLPGSGSDEDFGGGYYGKAKR